MKSNLRHLLNQFNARSLEMNYAIKLIKEKRRVEYIIPESEGEM